MTYEKYIKDNEKLIWSIVNNTKRKYYSHNFQKFLYSKFDKEDLFQELLTKIHKEWYTYDCTKGVKINTYFTNICKNYLSTLMQPYGAKKNQLKVITNVDLNRIEDDTISENTFYDKLTIQELMSDLEYNKNKDILLYLLNGETQSNVARKYGLSRQRVHQIWNEYMKEIGER